MTYKVVIDKKNNTFPTEGWNEVLGGRFYDYRTKRYRNQKKKDNDKICCVAINKYLKGVKLKLPIRCTYNIYAPNKKHDRQNLYSVDKSFLDALQQTRHIPNDGWKETLDSLFHTMVDAEHPRVEVIIEEMEG